MSSDDTTEAKSAQDNTNPDATESEPAEGNTDPDATEAAPTEIILEPSEVRELPAAENFTITDDQLGTGGPKAKFAMNMAAITVLKQIEAENRFATSEEQQILSKYVGWGGIPDAFDENKTGWEKEYRELKTTLTPEEYASARASTLNAHYTSPAVIKAIYEVVGNLGFQSGNILDITVTGLIQRTWERVA